MNPMKNLNHLTLILGLVVATASSAEPQSTSEKIQAALDHERRSEQESARDRNRKPLDTLEFFRLRDDIFAADAPWIQKPVWMPFAILAFAKV